MSKDPQQRQAEVSDLIGKLSAIRTEMLGAAETGIDSLHPNFQDSGRNLLHYLTMRRHDLRPIQLRLAALGLSSLGRAESHVLANVNAIMERLHEMHGEDWTIDHEATIQFEDGERLLHKNTDLLLGENVHRRDVRIMVTMPSEAAQDYSFIHQLVDRGMDCMRINCAHDGPAAWQRMIEHLHQARESLGKPCQVCMDLSGPRLRTGSLEPGPAAVKVRPQRDEWGQVTAPARIWLTAEEAPAPSPSRASTTLPVQGGWLATLQPGDAVYLTDSRRSHRLLKVVDVTPDGAWAEARKTCHFAPGIGLHPAGPGRPSGAIGALRARKSAIHLHEGDLLILTADQTPGRPATTDTEGRLLTPATIPCTLPGVFADVKAGHPIWFDDGKIGGVIERVEPERLLIRVTYTPAKGAKLRADKGINLPESELLLAALTEKDRDDLRFAARHADLIALSFANRAEDVELLQGELAKLGARDPGIVLKIETRRGFANLPSMLLAAMRSHCCGVMIARGDLAVECGFERLAEAQEEMLWLCEAAHVPVIWATQVLETLTKQGMPSRAEITDAAMSHRAECVMLNKGPHILKAVEVLDNILRRMQTHQSKKQSMLRALQLARTLPRPTAPLPDPDEASRSPLPPVPAPYPAVTGKSEI